MREQPHQKPYTYRTLSQAKPPYLIIKNKIMNNCVNQINTLKPALFKTDNKHLYKIVNYILKYLSYF